MPVRIRATAYHLLISLGIALLAAALVFGVWFPGDYRRLSGGFSLFLLITSVDVVLGPLLTLVVFNPKKPRAELTRDLAVVAALQLGALAYGLHAMALARPVALVQEVDRFRIVSVGQVLDRELAAAGQRLSYTGPRLMGTRAVTPGESVDAAELALQGYDVGQLPSFWQPYENSRAKALKHSRPLSAWLDHQPGGRAAIEEKVRSLGGDPATARFSVLISHVPGWSVVLDPAGNVLGFAPFEDASTKN